MWNHTANKYPLMKHLGIKNLIHGHGKELVNNAHLSSNFALPFLAVGIKTKEIVISEQFLNWTSQYFKLICVAWILRSNCFKTENYYTQALKFRNHDPAGIDWWSASSSIIFFRYTISWNTNEKEVKEISVNGMIISNNYFISANSLQGSRQLIFQHIILQYYR